VERKNEVITVTIGAAGTISKSCTK